VERGVCVDAHGGERPFDFEAQAVQARPSDHAAVALAKHFRCARRPLDFQRRQTDIFCARR
jgi:hypothetical protein